MTEQEIFEAAKDYAENELGIDDILEERDIISVWKAAIDWYQKLKGE